MQLTITCKGPNAGDLGYLLHKNPARPQTVELNYGKAHIFYTEAGEEVCSATLLLDINPIDLARGRADKGGGNGLFDYVNDRPYVASSFLSAAIAGAYGTAMSGRCALRPETAAARLPLTAEIVMLPSSGGDDTVRALFEPLGYTVRTETFPLNESFPEWGPSRYHNVRLSGEVRLCNLLSHLYVLIPVLDSAKHYWIGEDEIGKLLRHGEGWLSAHPMKEYIAVRYLKRSHRLIKDALLRLVDVEGDDTGDNDEEKMAEYPEERERRLGLNRQRMGGVVAALKNSGAGRVLDLGCGEGRLLSLLRQEREFREIAGMDVSCIALERAAQRLHIERMTEEEKERLRLIQGSFLYRDKRLAGYDACSAVEVVEHIEPSRLCFFEKNVFEYIRCKTVVLTTPNREYNDNYASLHSASLRHADHRFEWTRTEFRDWALCMADRYGYAVRFSGIGDADPVHGTPTQMAVFAL
jgi:3' terminal RNA ribose 2'-O-methyltransferase Hen1